MPNGVEWRNGVCELLSFFLLRRLYFQDLGVVAWAWLLISISFLLLPLPLPPCSFGVHGIIFVIEVQVRKEREAQREALLVASG
jgi:hypothetical protein